YPDTDEEALSAAKEDEAEGKAPSTQAGEFVREEMHHIREGKHGARSAKQAVAIRPSKARRARVGAAPPQNGTGSANTRKAAQRDAARGKARGSKHSKVSPKRSRAPKSALRREGRSAASQRALSRQASSSARRRGAAARSRAAKKAARTRRRR